MRRLTAFAAITLILFFTAALSAQEVARAEEVLKWFPQGKYMLINHRDDIRLAQGDAFELYQKYFEPSNEKEDEPGKNKGKNSPSSSRFFFVASSGISAGRILPKDRLKLPESLKEGLYSMTTTGALSLIDEPEGKREQVQTVTLGSMDSKDGGKQMGAVLRMSNSNMAVYRYDDLDGTIAAALEKNELTQIGVRLGGRPIYSFSVAKAGGRGGDQFAWASETGELLVAPDRKTLRKMYLAGHGRMPTMMDEPSYVDLVSIMPELGAKWSVHILSDLNQQLSRSFEEKGLDEERLKKLLERQANSPLMRVESLEVGERLVSRSYTIFEENDAAEDSFAKNDQGAPAQPAGVKEWSEYQQLLRERKKTELRDNVIVSTFEVDEKLLEAEKTANAAMQKQIFQKGGNATFTTADGKKLKMEIKQSKDGKNIQIKSSDVGKQKK